MAVHACRRGLSYRHFIFASSIIIAAFLFLFVTPTRAQTNLGSGVASVQKEQEPRILKTGIRNPNDEISIIQTGEGSANETANIIKRMRELSVQSSSETLATDERKYGDDELENGRSAARPTNLRSGDIELRQGDEDNTPPAEVLLDETVTVEDMGATHARILPDSPWHVFKRIGRGIQEAITFDPIKDAELKRQHAIQELAEVKQLVEERGASAVAPAVIAESLERFQDKLADATDAAKKLEEVKEEKPAAVAAVMADFTDKHMKEQAVLDNLAQDVLSVKEELSRATEEAGAEETKAIEQVLSVVEDTKAESSVHLAEVLFEVEKTPEAISARLTETIGQQKGSAFRDLKHLSVLDEIAKAAPESMQSAVDTAKQETVKKFEEKIKAVPPAVRAEKFKQYVEHTNGDEKRLFTLLDEIKQTADIPGDVLDKIEEAKEIAVRRFEKKLALIDDSDVQDRLLVGFIGADRVKDVVALEEFKDRMKSGSEAMKRVEEQHDKSVEAFKAKFTDAKSQEQADFFRKLSQEMTQNPSPKVFKLVRELEAEVRQDAEKSAFLDGLEKQMQGEIEAKFRREGERYVERYASLDPNDMAVFDAVDFDPAFKKQVLQKKTEKLKDFVKDIERPEEFDRFYERFYKAPDAVINNIKEQAPDFQQAMQFKWRKMEQQRLEEERQHQVNRARVDYEERELAHQFDRVTRKEDEQFFRQLTEIQQDDFEARKDLWEGKINRSYEHVDQRFAEQKRLFEERLKIDPFGCDETCRQVQITFIEQDQRHQKERLADQLQSERNRVEADQARQARNNPLAGKCSTPESCIAYCRANQGTPGCEWLAVEMPPACPSPAYWDQASRSCVTPTEVKPACGAGQYWDGKTCVEDPFYRPPEDFRRCGWGLRWSEDKATCVPDQRVNNCETVVVAGTVSYSENCDVPPMQLCPSDRRWDPLKRDCVPFDYQACGGGFYFDYGTRRCEKDARIACPAGQSWDEAKKICLAIAPERCPAFDILPCPDGHYREFKQTPNGCWLPGACVPVKQQCQKEPFPCPIGFSRVQKVVANGCVEYGQCEPPICPMVMPRVCEPGEAPIPPDLRRDPCGLSSCIPRVPEDKCPAYNLYFKSCPTGYRREFTADAKGCQVPGVCVPEKPPGPCPAMPAVECPAGQHREFTTNPDGCSVPGRCISDTEPVNSCGDGICNGAETPAICPADCRASEACNRNGVCDAGETPTLCPTECSLKETPVCGNSRCESGETYAACPRDCAPPPICSTPATCFSEGSCRGAGFVWCATTSLCYREAAACPAPARCGNGSCETGETMALCPADCAVKETPVCGNARCESGETAAACPADCGIPPGPGCGSAVTEATCKLKPDCEWRNTACSPRYANGVCGDNICGGSESQASCPADCKPADVCGDRICGMTETVSNCSIDCMDLQCAGSAYFCKTQDTCLARGSYWCSSRCQIDPCSGGGATCGNGRCEAVESGRTCPSDCSGTNNQCATSPAQCATPADCAASGFYWCNGACFASSCTGGTACNNNGTCDANETVANCAADCGSTACGSGWTYSTGSRSCVRSGVSCSAPKACDACRAGGAQYCEWNSDGCPISCRSSAFCGNGVCDAGETYGSCADCRGTTTGGTCATQASLCTTQSTCSTAGYFWCANTNICYSTQASSPCFTSPAVCGDRICAGTETAANCPADCGASTVPTCGSYVTQPTCAIHPGCSWYVPPSGTAGSCTVSGSTGGACNRNWICDVGETNASCPSDCNTSGGTATCDGDRICEVNESAASCPSDCGSGAGAATGAVCGSYVTQATCAAQSGCMWYTIPAGTTSSCVPVGSTGGTTATCPSYTTQTACTANTACVWQYNYCSYPSSGMTCNYNNICDSNESCSSCSRDCCPGTGGTCATQASLCTTQATCTAAAYFWCSNVCYATQTSNPCSTVTGACGDHVCQSNETMASCPVDCGTTGGTTGTCATQASLCTTQSACTSAAYFWCSNVCYATQASNPCATSTGSCGDHVCGSGETVASCPVDCGGGTNQFCDGICGNGESAAFCPGDCGSTSACASLPSACTGGPQCASAGYYWCSTNSICYSSQAVSPCAGSSAVCGNGICNTGETTENCRADCSYCGDQFCSPLETAAGCPTDCGGSTGGSCTTPSACTSSAMCQAAGFYWCAAASLCYSSQAVSGVCAPVGTCNNNGVCDGTESTASCPVDCQSTTTYTCSTSMPGMCHSSAECSSIGYFWCASSNMCYASQASSPCGSGSLGPSTGRVAWSRDPLERLAISVGEFAKSIFGFVAKAVGGL